MRSDYHNPWMPEEAVRILENEQGTILDVGGGAAPYCRAGHVLDIQPFDADRLTRNAWGGKEHGAEGMAHGAEGMEHGAEGMAHGAERRAYGAWRMAQRAERKAHGEESEKSEAPLTPCSMRHAPLVRRRPGEGGCPMPLRAMLHAPCALPLGRSALFRTWTAAQYTQLDLCGGEKWPFEDKQFDLGLCSHCLEDLRDPLPAVRELSRVCKRVLVITPSRLLEQTLGIDHPRYCGFYHHPWMVFQEDGKLVFRRKTPLVNFSACHIVCPGGMTLKLEHGAALFHGAGLAAEERMFWSERDDYEDYCRFIEPYRGRQDLFVRNPRRHGLKYRIWRLRQKYFGAA